jgi:hypothetical protein
MKSTVTAWLMIIIGMVVGVPPILAIGALSGGTLNHAGPPMEFVFIASLGGSLFLVLVGLIKLMA